MFKPRKVGWSDQGRRDLCEGGGNYLKYLKRGWNGTEGKDTKILKREGKLVQGVGALKRGGWNPLTNYDGVLMFSVVVHRSEVCVVEHIPLLVLP